MTWRMFTGSGHKPQCPHVCIAVGPPIPICAVGQSVPICAVGPIYFHLCIGPIFIIICAVGPIYHHSMVFSMVRVAMAQTAPGLIFLQQKKKTHHIPYILESWQPVSW